MTVADKDKRQFSWAEILLIDIDNLMSDSQNLMDEAEILSYCLSSVKISPEDPEATPANLMHLFKLSQVVMRVSQNILDDAELRIKTREVVFVLNSSIIMTARIRKLKDCELHYQKLRDQRQY
jgi:hypothetical protein